MSALDLDADTGRKTETLECVDDARVEVEDVDNALVRAHLELLARVLVDEWTADHCELGDLGWEWDGAGSARVGTAGPIPLPTEIAKLTVIRSPFIDKDSREQFEMRTHKRVVDILDFNPRVVDALQRLSLPAGVSIEIKS